MKKIFQQIFSSAIIKKPNHFKAWLSELKDMDDLAALHLSTRHLTQLANTATANASEDNQAENANTLTTTQRLNLITELEDLNKSRLEKLAVQLCNVENMKVELENSIFDACYNYCRQSYIVHLKLIEQVFGAEASSVEKNDVPDQQAVTLLVARALNAANNMIKWRLFSQTNPPAKVWSQVNTLYKIASKHNLLNVPVEVFNLSPLSTLAAYFVQCWMLGQLAQASLQKYHVEITMRILNTLCTRAHISSQYTPEQYLFFIDLEKDEPAKRMRDAYASDSCRYWELDELEKQLTIAMTVSDRGEIPQSLAFSKIDHAKKLNETLAILIEEWKGAGYLRQRRKTPRYASSRTARVNAGMADICSQVHQSNQIKSGLRLSRDGTTLDERLRAHTTLRQSSNLSVNSGTLDTWIITDESQNGLGTRVNKYANILARPNKLIGLMIDDDPSKITIGMIRSVKPTQANQLRVGIEIISHHPVSIQLMQSPQSERFGDTIVDLNSLKKTNNLSSASVTDMGYFSGIYLPIEAGLSDSSMLLLPKISFRANSNYIVNMNGESSQILLGEPVESRDDWVKVSFPF